MKRCAGVFFGVGRSRQGGAADGEGDGDAGLLHGELYGTYDRVAVRAAGGRREYASVQLRRRLEVSFSGTPYQGHEEPPGAMFERVLTAPSALARSAGRIWSSEPTSTVKSGLTGVTS
jgi:hypothetical protein